MPPGGSGDEGTGTTSAGENDDPSATDSTGPATSGQDGSSTSGSTSGAGETDESTSADPSGGGVRFDVGRKEDIPDPTEGVEEGCTKVDFLFVIDNSGSMEDEQENLANSFPGFIDAIEDQLGLEDFQILVTDSDEYHCPTRCNTAQRCNGVDCDDVPPPGACDDVLGAGMIQNGRFEDCGVTGGHRYMTQDQPDLDGTFACLGSVGTGGWGFERMMDATTAALGPQNAAGACNEGFVRDDAILVVTIITDEEDDTADGTGDTNSSGNPASWKQAVVDAKGGDEGAVVVLGLIGDNGTPGAICEPLDNDVGAEPSPRLRTFTESFAFGQWGSVCATDYAPFFSQAVSVIDSACDVFMPPG